jgi:hypothetical protein
MLLSHPHCTGQALQYDITAHSMSAVPRINNIGAKEMVGNRFETVDWN